MKDPTQLKSYHIFKPPKRIRKSVKGNLTVFKKIDGVLVLFLLGGT